MEVESVVWCGALLQLLSHASFTHKVWFPSRDVPVVPLLLSFNNETINVAAALFCVSSLLVQLLFEVTRKSTTTTRFLEKVAIRITIVSFTVAALGNVAHLQPPVLHGLALLLLSSTSLESARVVLSATWFWSGLHKVNPSFLTQPNMLADPVYSVVLGKDFVSNHIVGLHLMTALLEATSGFVLLLHRFQTRLYVRLTVVYLTSMHALIVVRLVQANWNYSVLGWNANCLCLVVSLWWRQPTTKHKEKKNKMLLMVTALVFAVLPVLVSVGKLDPYLGSALYTDNTPKLELELPVTPILRSSGLYNVLVQSHLTIPAVTHDGRWILLFDALHYNVAVTGNVGYPSVWAHKEFSARLCQQIGDIDAEAANRVQAYLQVPYQGKTLVWSLWALTTQDGKPPPLPPKYALSGCFASWEPFQDQVTKSTFGLIRRDTSRRAVFVSLSSAADLYWVAPGFNELVFQGKIGTLKDPLLIDAHISHVFVATQEQEDDAICALEVWVVVPSATRQQRFVLDDSKRKSVDVAGLLKACPQKPVVYTIPDDGTCSSEQGECLPS